MTRTSRRRSVTPLLASLTILAILAGAGWFAVSRFMPEALPDAPACTFTDSSKTVELSPDRARNAAIIAGVAAADPELGRQGAVVGIATAYQESGLRNLDHGDRDSQGLFQQRPSQGWGTVEQIRDPWYASRAFYKELKKVKGWQTGDVNDMAQKVQRSGVPDGYRKHIENATAVGRVLSGEQIAAISCTDRDQTASDARGLAQDLAKTYGVKAQVSDKTITVTAPTSQLAWSMGSFAVASTRERGVVAVRVGDRTWKLDPDKPHPWMTTTEPAKDGPTTVEITVR